MTKTKKSILIGVLCITIYIINYYLRNMLSVFTPELIENYAFTESRAALLSSVYMCFYAAGQLINGFVGDVVSPKKMCYIGTTLAAVMTMLFPFVNALAIQVIIFALIGFGLSMVRGPLMKTISENTEPKHARTICVFFSFASFAGPLIAGLFATAFDFKLAFTVAGAVGALMILAGVIILHTMEKRKVIGYRIKEKNERLNIKDALSVFKIEKFGFYLAIACIVETAATSISFWIPTYLSSELGFDTVTSAAIFSSISIARATMPFIALFLFNLTGEKDIAMMRIAFLISSLSFIISIFVKAAAANVIIIIIALMAMSCSSSLLWSIYIPGLGKTGKVSSVNGILDCSGYIAAALANLAFAAVMTSIGWRGVILLWASLGAIGIAATFFAKKKDRSRDKSSEATLSN